MFFTQSQSRNTRSRFEFSCTKDADRAVTLGRFSRVYSRRRDPITAQNVGKIVRYIRNKLVRNKVQRISDKLVRNTLDLSHVSLLYVNYCEFCTLADFDKFFGVSEFRFLGRSGIFFPHISYITCSFVAWAMQVSSNSVKHGIRSDLRTRST